MTTESIVQFFIQYNETIITVTLASIVLLAGVTVYTMAFSKKLDDGDSAAELDRIEKALEKIMGKIGEHNVSSAGYSSSTASSGAAGESTAGPQAASGGGASANTSSTTAEVEKLKKELEEKSKELSQVKEKIESSKEDDNTPELLAKIKLLEDKLAEYEIIEDDIADLSLFKEENQKLKKELESLKGGGANPEDEKTKAEAKSSEQDSAESDEIVSNFEDVVDNIAAGKMDIPKPEVAKEIEVAPQSQEEPEVEAAPEAKEESAKSKQSAQEATTAPVAAAAAAKSDSEAASGDVFSEFEEGGDGGENEDLLAQLGDIDTDRMLDEIKSIGGGADRSEALEEELDVDKVAEEAKSLPEKPE